MRAKILLADYAKVSDGKVDALGLGWTTTVTPTPPAAVVLLLQIGWDETNRPLTGTLELLDADGQPVHVTGPHGPHPLRISFSGEAGRPAGVPAGSMIDLPVTATLGPGLPLVASQRYEWRLTIDGETQEDWVASFFVRPS